MNFRNKLTVAVVAALAILLPGCYPDGPETYEDLDVVVTYFNDQYDFAGKGTYSRPDRIVIVTGNLQEGDAPEFIPDGTAALILAQIDKNMQSLGWTKVELSGNPDVLLTPASWERTTVMYSYDYWYWWYGGYYPGWGGYYPAYVGAYTTGTLLMGIIDPADVGANGRPIVQWTGAINGVMTDRYDPVRINNAIDQAFAQSQYLKTN